MNFVKTSILKHEITASGVTDVEVDALTKEERANEEFIKSLPEFNQQQKWAGFDAIGVRPTSDRPQPTADVDEDADQTVIAGKTLNPNTPAPVTEDDFRFLEALKGERRRRVNELQIAENREVDEFRAEKQKRHVVQNDSDNTISQPDGTSTALDYDVRHVSLSNIGTTTRVGAVKSSGACVPAQKTTSPKKRPISALLVKKRKTAE